MGTEPLTGVRFPSSARGLSSLTIFFSTKDMIDNKDELLEVVDENDEVIAVESRGRIHKEGLLHRDVNVWLVTPDREIIFQHRSKDKDTYPDKFDATVAGHVDPGETYLEAGIREVAEEAGLHLSATDLVYLGKSRHSSVDDVTGTKSNHSRETYCYVYRGNISELVVEEGKSLGFVAFAREELRSIDPKDERFIPMFLGEEYQAIYDRLIALA